MIGVSSSYLSQVEKGYFDPPTASRVHKIAELLGEDTDEWIGMAGRVPDDIEVMVKQHPTDMPELVRLATGCTPEEFQEIKELIRNMRGV